VIKADRGEGRHQGHHHFTDLQKHAGLRIVDWYDASAEPLCGTTRGSGQPQHSGDEDSDKRLLSLGIPR
jgi:hypothetical protein